MTDLPLIDPAASLSENIGAILEYREAADAAEARERARAAEAAERHRVKITAGRPPYIVLRAMEKGYAPSWVMDTLRGRIAV